MWTNRPRRSAWRALATTLVLMGAADATARAANPDEIIGNEECRVKFAREHALLYWPSEEGTRFAILNNTGTVFGGELPFASNYYRKTFLIERGDGSVLFAFANLAYASSVYAEPDAEAPVRVYLDGETIYETDNAGEFDVSDDGASFFTVEPLAEDVRDLVIREVGSGEVRRIDLAERFASLDIPEPDRDRGRGYVARYSLTQDEVMVMPAFETGDVGRQSRYGYRRSNGLGDYLFYPIGGGERRISITDDPLIIFESSRHAYFLRSHHGYSHDGHVVPAGDETEIFKRKFFWDGHDEPKRVDVWTRRIDLDVFHGWSEVMTLTDDGAWLMLHAPNHHILDAATGKTIFAFPTAENLSRTSGLGTNPWRFGDHPVIDMDKPVGRAYYEHALARLRGVLPFDATVDDVTVVSGYRIGNGEIALSQYVRRESTPGERPKYAKVEYVFDMDNTHADAKPGFRREVESEQPTGPRDAVCQVGVASGRGLQVSGDEIVYRSTGQSSHAN